LPWAEAAGSSEQPWKYNGKEFVEMHGLDEYDSKARWYYSAICRTTTMDPLAEKYYSTSPYAWCGNNPVRFVDPDGMDWLQMGDSINWTNYKSQDELDANNVDGTYLGEAFVEFNGSYDEKLGEGDNLFGKGANLATVIVYGPRGRDDIKTYQGFSMTSDFNKFGAIQDGMYEVNYRIPGKSGNLKSNWAINNTNPVDCINGINPSPIKPYSSTQKNGIYIHRSNNNGFAGGTVSTGCLLIVPSGYGVNGWNEFNQQLRGVNSFTLLLQRK
jgi:RHS repeat-associated protein